MDPLTAAFTFMGVFGLLLLALSYWYPADALLRREDALWLGGFCVVIPGVWFMGWM